MDLTFDLGPKTMCVSGFSSEKLGMVGRHNILFFTEIFYVEIEFCNKFFGKFDSILLTFRNKMFRVGAKLS